MMAETKEVGKAVLAALKTKGGGRKATKASDASSADSASSPSAPRQPTSWQAWGKHVLADVDAYGAFKASYAHPVNGSKQGVSFAYQQHRAYLNHESAEGGLTEEYEAFIAPFLEAKAAKAAAATPKKAKAAAAAVAPAAPPAPLKAVKAKGGAGAPSEEDEEGAFSSSSSLVLFADPPKPPAPTPGSLKRLPTLTPEASAVVAAEAAAAAAPKVLKKVSVKAGGAAKGGKAKAEAKATAPAAAAAAAAPHRSVTGGCFAPPSDEKGAAIFARSEPEPWTWNGRALLKNIRNEVWATDGEGEREWVGVYDPEADTMDEMVDEPSA